MSAVTRRPSALAARISTSRTAKSSVPPKSKEKRGALSGVAGRTSPPACGTLIVAGQSGTVTYAGYHDNMGGNMVYINHAGNMQTRYAHMNGVFYVRSGQSVSAGQPIGQVGATGAALGCHLHYEVLRNGSFINPINYL